jgi:hypothetical protein
METVSYKVGDLKRIIRESAQNGFKPVLGPNVVKDNTKNNEKSYKESEKRAKDFDGGLNEPKKMKLPAKMDGNKTTLDYNPSADPDENYKKRVKAQAEGYTSDLEKNNGNERGGVEMDDEGRILKQFNDARDKAEEKKKMIQKSGLTAREFPENTFDKNHLNESKPKAKKLIFKHSKFINETQVYSRIPEEYKKDGQRIYMNDAAGNEYIVECVKSEKSGCIETQIVSHKNEKLMNEQINRIHELMNYSESTTSGKRTSNDRLNESDEFQNIMDIARGKKTI